MVFPPGVTTGTVFIQAPLSFGGSDGTVFLEVTPSSRIIHTATGRPLADFMVAVAPGAGMSAQVILPHVDQSGFQNEAGQPFTHWSYMARVRYEMAGQVLHAPLRFFQILQGQASVDLSLIPAGPPVVAQSAAAPAVSSLNGRTGPVDTFKELARTPEVLIVGAVTLDTGGAVNSAGVVWPDGTAGVFTGTASVAFPGALDSYAITYGSPITKTYTQPAVTRNAAGQINAQPAITVS